jgi:hypothetical protein
MKNNFFCTILFLVYLGLTSYAIPLSATQQLEKQKEIDFIILSNLFPETKSREMKISFELWATKLFVNAGLNYKINLLIVDIDDFTSKNYNIEKNFMVVLSSVVYLKTKNDRILEPILITYEDNTQEYIILGSNEIENIDQLRNKRIALTNVGFGEIAEFWLKSIIGGEYKLNMENFFLKLNYLDTESQCVNSVFFKNDNACVVREDVYNLACELNPQIKEKTKVLRKSEKLLHSIFCLTNKFTEEERQKFIDAVFKIQSTPDGEQILNLFKRTKLIAYKDEYIENIKRLYNNNNRIMNLVKP